MSWAEAVAHMKANPDRSGPVVYNLTPQDETSGPVSLSAAACPGKVIIDGGGKTVELTGWGSLLEVREVDITLRNITLKGRVGNTRALVFIARGGTVRLEAGGIIRDNDNASDARLTHNRDHGGGVNAAAGGTFYMSGGEIRGNTAFYGGGLYVEGEPFPEGPIGAYLSGGTIISNFSRGGGGGGLFIGFTGHGYIDEIGYGKVEISGTAAITYNTSSEDGGGAALGTTGRLIMSGGAIQYNTSVLVAGGVLLPGNNSGAAVLDMSGGIISDNWGGTGTEQNGVHIYGGAEVRMGGDARVDVIYFHHPQPVKLSGDLTADIAADLYPAGSSILEGDTGVVARNYRRFLIRGVTDKIDSNGNYIN
jgi:hypothetical protein